MDIEERQDRIVELVRARKRIKSNALTEIFGVSLETIRKDLMDLHERGDLIRVHGGATVRPDAAESAYEGRRTVNAEAKNQIARLAAATVSDGTTIYLDYGTTTYSLADELVRMGRKVTVLTSSLPIANRLADSEFIETVVLGGILRRNERSLYGPIAERSLESVYMDAGFFGCAGLHHEAGLTNHHPIEAAASRLAMSHCKTVAAVVDADKFGTIAPNKLADIAELDLLITNAAPGPEFDRVLGAADITICTPGGNDDH